MEGLIISPFDKNIGVLHAQCAYTWHQDFENTFIRDPHYEVINQDLEEVFEQQRSDYMASGLGDIAPWQKSGRIPYCYILKKFKN